MYYRHNLNYIYPEKSDQHMITVKHLRNTNFDENYEYLPKGFWHKVARGILRIGLYLVGFPLATIRHGLKIHGRRNLKENKELLKDGAITVSNHVFMWDYLCILKAIRPHLQYHPGWKTNFEGPNAFFIRWVGGIPIPTDNIRAMAKFNKAITEVVQTGKWLHFFPEGSMWFYYPNIRPFKKAVFKYAVRFNKPIIPLAFSFRPRKGIMKLFGKTPLVDLHIGKPMFSDNTLPINEAIDKIHQEVYFKVQELAGINPDNKYFNINQNIDEYQKTM